MNSRSLGAKYFVSALKALHTQYVLAGVDQNCAPPHSWISTPSMSRYHTRKPSASLDLTNTPPIPSTLGISSQLTDLTAPQSIAPGISRSAPATHHPTRRGGPCATPRGLQFTSIQRCSIPR